MRVGLVTKKLGMSSLYLEDGTAIAVTLLHVDNCAVVSNKTIDKDGYNAVQIGASDIKIKNVTKPLKGHYAKNKVEPRRKLKEFRVSESGMIKEGTLLSASHFVVGQYVDASAVTQGKGFAGVMKRWGFAGLRASHGVSISHRSHGSTGCNQDPGRVIKGKKMAGHMGAANRTAQNLKIMQIIQEDSIIVVKGAVPGSKGAYVYLTDAIKKALPRTAPVPTFFSEEVQNFNDDLKHEECSNES